MKISTLFSRSFLFTGVLLFAALVSNAAAAPRDISLLPVSGAAGSKVLVPIQFTAQGDETNTAFSVHFDASVLSMSGVSGINSNPDVMKGPGATANQKIGVNALNVSNGNVGLLIDFTGGLSPVVPISAGTADLIPKVHDQDRRPGRHGVSRNVYQCTHRTKYSGHERHNCTGQRLQSR